MSRPSAPARASTAAAAARSPSGRVSATARAWIAQHRLLALLLLGGLLLRGANLTWGLPLSPYSDFFHGDESKVWYTTISFPEQYLANSSYLYGTALQNAIGLVLWPVKAVMVKMLGMPEQYILLCILFSRLCNVLLGTGSILALYQLGRRLWDEPVGLAAAALLAVSPGPCLHSCYVTLDVPMSFLLVAGLLLVLHLADHQRPGPAVWLGIVAGTLAGTKIVGVLFFFVSLAWLLAVWFLVSGGEAAVPPSRRWALAGLYVLVTAITFAISSPQIVLSLREYLAFMQQQKATWYDKAPDNPLAITQVWYRATSLAVTTPVAVLAAAGLLAAGRAKATGKLLLLAMLVVYYGFWRAYLPARFVIFVAPLICLAAAVFCRFLCSHPWPAGRGAGLFCLVASLLYSTAQCGAGVVQRLTDPRPRASRFIAQHIPPQATLGIATDHNLPWGHHKWRYPPIDLKRYQIRHFLDRPQYLVVTSIELDVMRRALQSEKLLAGYRWDPRAKDQWYLSDPPAPAIFQFYAELLAGRRYRLLAEFSPLVRSRTEIITPDVYIYQRR